MGRLPKWLSSIHPSCVAFISTFSPVQGFISVYRWGDFTPNYPRAIPPVGSMHAQMFSRYADQVFPLTS